LNCRSSAEKDYLFEAILSLETKEECSRFFEDLCTVRELDEMAKRLCGAKMLDEGMVYSDITAETKLSTATISRIGRCLRYGSDGYSAVLKRLDEKGIIRPEPGKESEEQNG